MLTGGARDIPQRQRTLAETIRWSVENLTDHERRLFARLAVFAGGFRAAAAEAVCGNGIDVIDSLGALVDASLVRRIEGADGSLRFAMLETIREYARDRFMELETSECADVERRHARYVLDLVERARPHLTDEEQMRWLAELDAENENIRAALAHAERMPDSEDDVGVGLRTAAAVWRFWQVRGRLNEGRDVLARLLDLPGARRRDEARAAALGALGSIDYWHGETASMTAAYEEAADIAEELGDRHLLGDALFNLSFVPTAAGHPEDALPIIERCLEVVDPADTRLRGRIMHSLGLTTLFAGDPTAAVEPIERAIELLESAGEDLATCEALEGLGFVHLRLGDVESAFEDLARATDIARDSANPLLIGLVAFAHALAANRTGAFERAAQLVGAMEMLERTYDLQGPAAGFQFFGDPADEARAALGEEAFERARSEGAELDLMQVAQLLTRAFEPDADLTSND
jgi:tetratricopeptide (TPR) repeat protein